MIPRDNGDIVLSGPELLVAVAAFYHANDDRLQEAANAYRLNELMRADERHYGIPSTLGGEALRATMDETTVVVAVEQIDDFLLGVADVYAKAQKESRARNIFRGGIAPIRRARTMRRDSANLLTSLNDHQTTIVN